MGDVPKQVSVPPTDVKAKRWPQYIAALAACLGGFSLGCCLGWSAPVTAIWKREKTFTDFQANLAGSALTIGAALGMIVVPFLVDAAGRKLTMLCLVPPFVGGWTILMFGGSNIYVFMAGRAVTGACGGMFCVCAPIYTGEIAQKEVRGVLGVFFQLLLVNGILYTYCIGYTDSVKWVSGLCGICPLIFLVIMIFMPESPYFYLMKDKEEKARKAVHFFRGKDFDIEPEINEMKESVAEGRKKKVTFAMLTTKPVLKTLGLAYGIMFAQQLCGINAVIFYVTIIFEAAGSKMDPLLQSIIVAFVQVVACLISVALVDRAGRKILMIVSESVMGVCLLFLGGYFLLKEKNSDAAASIAWLPLILTCLYIMAFCLGAGPIPWAYMSEIFPSELKGVASSSAAFINWMLAFVVTVSFSSLIDGIGTPAVMWIFTAICVLNVCYCIFCMIETKGKTLEEIQRELGNRSAVSAGDAEPEQPNA